MRRTTPPLVASALLLASALVTASEQPASADQSHPYLQFNVCGNICYEGGLEAADHLRDSILAWRPVIVTLNEICRPQAERLSELLRGSDHPMDHRFVATTVTTKCPGEFGNAVFTRGPIIGDAEIFELPNAAVSEQRKMICVETALEAGATVLACSVHIVYPSDRNNGANHKPQIDRVAEIVNERARSGTAVVLGGDFNEKPDRSENGRGPTLLRAITDEAVGGMFDEVDRADNERTLGGSKVDHIFFSANRFCCFDGQPTDPVVSDHRLLRGTATLRG